MTRRSRRAIEMSFDLRYLNPKAKRKMPKLLSEEELLALASKYITEQGEGQDERNNDSRRSRHGRKGR